MHGGGRGLHKKFEFGRLCLVRDWKDGKMVGKEGRDELWMEKEWDGRLMKLPILYEIVHVQRAYVSMHSYRGK